MVQRDRVVIRFAAIPGTPGLEHRVVVQKGFGLAVVESSSVDESQIVTHDETDHELAFALSRLSDQDLNHTVTGIFRNAPRTTYDDAACAQVQAATDARPDADLQALLNGRDTWTAR
ncbi:hypothetical protein WIS52_04595 [Pseudonocardia nematodicida]|uniref:Uncharacterized protein n=1 Tax=Pseudonocardia nematodicida TaxID=1206997 RepID=A0ABV1K5L1_9PSEU